ncbi:hypothetical protein Goari_009516 [Gossypium aridum]|uniref:Uncharacterized protein n=1 Tax=Gossypium aridum TaxID=34290 RepID=A0A7J8XXA2_GOSAI|nr:hypothetical protein [Gossypium aridum]
MLSAVEECVGKLEESIEDSKELDNTLREIIDNLREQPKDFVAMCFSSNKDIMQELIDSQMKKLTERNDALEAMVMTLKKKTMVTMMALSTRIDELEGELALCRAAVGKGVSSVALSNEDVPKLKKFVGTRSVCDVDNFLWRMESYFHAKGITDDAVKGQFYPEFTEKEAQAKLQGITQRGTVGEYV